VNLIADYTTRTAGTGKRAKYRICPKCGKVGLYSKTTRWDVLGDEAKQVLWYEQWTHRTSRGMIVAACTVKHELPGEATDESR
jgi:hypothetical protein